MTHDYKRNGVTTLFAALVAAKRGVTQMQSGEECSSGNACRATGKDSCASLKTAPEKF